MRKILVISLVLLMLLSVASCASNGVSEGFYQHKYASYVWVSFEADGFFACNYREKMIDAVDMSGTYTVQDGKVICTDGESTLVFEIVDNDTVRYVEEGSKPPYAFYLDNGTELTIKAK